MCEFIDICPFYKFYNKLDAELLIESCHYDFLDCEYYNDAINSDDPEEALSMRWNMRIFGDDCESH